MSTPSGASQYPCTGRKSSIAIGTPCSIRPKTAESRVRGLGTTERGQVNGSAIGFATASGLLTLRLGVAPQSWSLDSARADTHTRAALTMCPQPSGLLRAWLSIGHPRSFAPFRLALLTITSLSRFRFGALGFLGDLTEPTACSTSYHSPALRR